MTGTVKGAYDNLPVSGAKIQIKGSTASVTTDNNGNFRLNAPPGQTIEISYPGMKTNEIVTGSSALLDVVLESEYTDSKDVLDYGYGIQFRSDLAGNIGKIDGNHIRNLPVPDLEQALQGKVAGTFIEQANGKSASPAIMRIRGTTSILAGSSPLFVVDGIPITTESLNLTGAQLNPLETISLTDIESVDILKDGASTAMYGARGANGVVIITTRKGISGESKLNFTIQSGFSEASRRRKFMDAGQYISFFRDAAINGDLMEDARNGNPAGTSTYWKGGIENQLTRFSGWAANIDGLGFNTGSKANTDWQDLVFRKGKVYSADLSAEGGTDRLRYYTDLSYNNFGGIIVSNGIEKISGRLNVDSRVNKYIDLGFSLGLNRNNINQISADNSFSSPLEAVALAPVTPPYDQSGQLSNSPVTTYYNPLVDIQNSTRTIIEYRTLLSAYLEINILKSLKWRNEIGFDLYDLKENARYGKLTASGAGVNGIGYANYGQTQNLDSKSYLDYTTKISELDINALLGTELQYATVDNAYALGMQFPLDELKTLASAGSIASATSSLSKYSFLSYYSRINLDYGSKYLLSLTGRIDGSSRFGKSSRYGFFPGISAGWVLSEEDFLLNSNFISLLKLRLSYGRTGNSNIGNFNHTGLYNLSSYNGQTGLIPAQVPNEDLRWESSSQIDLGIEYGFFKGRISGDFDIYTKKSKDLLLMVPIPSTSGYTDQLRNVGSVENKGYEFNINTENLTGSFTWSTSLNFSFNKNEVTGLAGQTTIDPGSARYMNVVKTGESLGSFFGAEYAGVDPANGDALWFINARDVNGNITNPSATTSQFNDANFVILGHPIPDYTGAITNTFGFKGFEFSFMFQGVAGNKIHLIADQWMASNGIWYDNQLTSQLASWKKPGDITEIPQARLGWANGDQSRSSRYLSDGSYIKLRSCTLSYDVPGKLVNKIKLDRMKIFVQAQNLIMFTKYKGWDPEVTADFLNDNITSGADYYSAPQPRTIVFGINIGL